MSKSVASFVLLFLLLTACDGRPTPLTNDLIIQETNKCKETGFDAQPLYALATGDQIIRIMCVEKGSKK